MANVIFFFSFVLVAVYKIAPEMRHLWHLQQWSMSVDEVTKSGSYFVKFQLS